MALFIIFCIFILALWLARYVDNKQHKEKQAGHGSIPFATDENIQQESFVGPAPLSNNAGGERESWLVLLKRIESTVAGVESSLGGIKQDLAALKEKIELLPKTEKESAALEKYGSPSDTQDASEEMSGEDIKQAHLVKTLLDGVLFVKAQGAASAEMTNEDPARPDQESLLVAQEQEFSPRLLAKEALNKIAAAQHEVFVQAEQKVSLPKIPTFLERVWESLAKLGIGKIISASNVWVLAGVCIVLIGLIFLVKLAAEHQIISEEVRLLGASFIGFALLGVGWKHREKHRELGLLLQGGGVGALYVIVVAAVHLYDLIPRNFAFVLLIGLVVFSTFLAIVQYAKLMAHVAYIAGFSAPLLVSSGSNNFIGLFSFYILLNLGIVLVSKFRKWPSLYTTGFLFTSLIGAVWGEKSYDPAFFWTVELFLNIFFLIFSYLALTGTSAKNFTLKEKLAFFTDVPLTFGTPLVYFIFQVNLLGETPFALAFTTLGLGFYYLGITIFLRSRVKVVQDVFNTAQNEVPATLSVYQATLAGLQLKMHIYFVYAILFANVTLPLALYEVALDAWRERIMALAWSMEGALLYWVGRRQDIKVCRVLGLLGFVFSVLPLLTYMARGLPVYQYVSPGAPLPGEIMTSAPAVLKTAYGRLGLSIYLHVMYACSFLVAAYVASGDGKEKSGLRREKPQNTQQILFWCGFGAFTLLCLFELSQVPSFLASILVVYGVVGFCADAIGKRIGFTQLAFFRLCPYAPLFCIGVPAIFHICVLNLTYFFWEKNAYDTFISLPACILAITFVFAELWLLRKKVARCIEPFGSQRLVLLSALCVPLLIYTTLSVFAELTELTDTWLRLILFVWPCIVVIVFTRKITPYYLAKERDWMLLSFPSVFFLFFWLLSSFFRLGDPEPLLFIPLLNPLEIALGCSVFALVLWSHMAIKIVPTSQIVRFVCRTEVLGIVIFILLNMTVVRSCSLYVAMPFSLIAAMKHPVCQSLFTILWGMSGFIAMYFGNKIYNKQLWLVGGGLVLADIIKLFLIDLTRVETGWRIAAFLLVGILLIVTGYYFPLPPSKDKAPAKVAEGEFKESVSLGKDSAARMEEKH